jgi:DNA-binding MarR family transcriptional regulator
MTEAELNSISTKYESFRLRDQNREKYLLQSILQHGIREPLQCVQGDGVQNYILLDGFKRLRCCYRLRLHMVPVVSLGTDEVACILQFIRLSAERSLSTLEQAHFVDELHSRYGLMVGEIAERLERSKAWVSVRLGILEEMSQVVREAVFSGRFPVRCYMYTLRAFTRVNGIAGTQIDRFVHCVSGKGLSTRDIEKLAYGYFRGGDHLRRQIEEGNLGWTLRQMRKGDSVYQGEEGLSETEWSVIRDLELAQKYMSRIQRGLTGEELRSQAFRARAMLVVEGLLDTVGRFQDQLRRFHESRAYQTNR